MKFNEKLIELRKKEGLSQEELGYKLNVTRQTISKWELGQTTPEMDKLVEIGKIFDIKVDDLISEAEITKPTNTVIEDQPVIEKKENKNNTIIVVGIILVIIVLVGLIFTKIAKESTNLFGNLFENIGKQAENVVQNVGGQVEDDGVNVGEQSEGIFENVGEQLENVLENAGDLKQEFNQDFNETKEEIKNTKNQFEIDSFNSQFELYQGTKASIFVETLFDKIITNNKKQEQKITLKFLQQELTDPAQIKNMKKDIEDRKEYEVSFEYNQDGYIYEAIVEEIVD